MKWTFIIQQKIKVISLLTAMIALICVTNYLEHRNLNQIDESFNSIYYDRLIPAEEVFHMTQNLYNQRILMESALRSKLPVSYHVDNALDELVRDTETRVVDFEKTFLVKHESYALSTFKRDLFEYEKIETKIIAALNDREQEEALKIYHSQLCPKFTETLRKLEDLASIQTSVGKGIFEQSRSAISSSTLVLTLQIIAAIIIGLMVHALIIASRMANINANNFHLN